MIDPISDMPGLGSNSTPMPASVELNATMLENQRWLAQLESDDPEAAVDPIAHNVLPRVGIDGAGFFVLDDAGARVFARAVRLHVAKDGRFVDDRGRNAMALKRAAEGASENDGRLVALSIPAQDLGLYKSYDVDVTGTVWGTLRAASHKHRVNRKVELGQLAVAVFPNPQTLQSIDRDVLGTSPTSGLPQYVPADAPHVGRLRLNPTNPSHEALMSNLRTLWIQSGRAEIEIALAASKDSLARVALNLVR
jgi:hypothetical protein